MLVLEKPFSRKRVNAAWRTRWRMALETCWD
jgi:hypothetical protein